MPGVSKVSCPDDTVPGHHAIVFGFFLTSAVYLLFYSIHHPGLARPGYTMPASFHHALTVGADRGSQPDQTTRHHRS